jgi:hypothetical protein
LRRKVPVGKTMHQRIGKNDKIPQDITKASGIVNINLLPWQYSLSAQIVPPWREIKSLQIPRPKPEPLSPSVPKVLYRVDSSINFGSSTLRILS